MPTPVGDVMLLEFCPGQIYNLATFDSNQYGLIYRDGEGWIPIQTRGQCGYPKDFFSKTWNEFRNGFGVPGMS
jgi:hypothetical protein